MPLDFVPDQAMEFLPCASSKAFLQELHAFQAQRVTPFAVDVVLSGYALALYESFVVAVH